MGNADPENEEELVWNRNWLFFNAQMPIRINCSHSFLPTRKPHETRTAQGFAGFVFSVVHISTHAKLEERGVGRENPARGRVRGRLLGQKLPAVADQQPGQVGQITALLDDRVAGPQENGLMDCLPPALRFVLRGLP